MTPKEKAEELVDKYKYLYDNDGKLYLHASLNIAKRYALITITEIINALDFDFENSSEKVIYYLKVKQEIEKL
jgi:hypothetical protein